MTVTPTQLRLRPRCDDDTIHTFAVRREGPMAAMLWRCGDCGLETESFRAPYHAAALV